MGLWLLLFPFEPIKLPLTISIGDDTCVETIGNVEEQNTRQAVFFQHGLFDSSDGWICNYEKNCLPFIFVNRGFDVVS